MSAQQQDPTVDGLDQPRIVLNPDGTVTRLLHFPTKPAADDPSSTSTGVRSKDVPVNPTHNIWVRIFLPPASPPPSPSAPVSTRKSPLIVYFHGGGFVYLSSSTAVFHDFCCVVAARLSAVVVSVDYRLAPEHRLPAAYDDAMEVLQWIRTAADNNDGKEEWLRDFADISNCFLMGTSAGGNIAYYAGLRACSSMPDLEPLKIRGLILHHPFFGGNERTESELRMFNDAMLPLKATDQSWELSLPAGADRDHEYCNPTVREEWGKMKETGCGVVVIAGGRDPLVDRQRELFRKLEAERVDVVELFHESDGHAAEVFEPAKAEQLLDKLRGLLLRPGASALSSLGQTVNAIVA